MGATGATAMKIAVIYNISHKGVINVFGRQNREQYRVEEIEAVVEALRQQKHLVETFEGDKFLIEKLEAFMPRVLKGEIPGLVFNLAYGIQGESRYTHIPSLLEMLGVPYLGSGPLAHSIALDKAMTKLVLSRAGLPTPAFQVFTDGAQQLDPSLRFPMIVKPKDEAVSFGIQVVHDETALRHAVATTLEEFRQPALVEEFLTGRELNIGLLGNGEQIEVLPLLEVDFGDSEERFQTFDTKKQHRYAYICPAQLPAELTREIQEIAKRAFATVGCRDCARVDLRLDEQGRPSILEINSMAAIHRNGSFFAAAQQAGYDYPKMINRMVEVAAQRYFGRMEKPTVAAASESKEEAVALKVTEFLRSASSKMESRLEELVNCNSYPRNKEGTDRVGRTVQRSLEALGFGCQVFPQTEIGNLLLFQNSFDGDRADVLLLSHLDTFALEYETHRRFSKEGNRLYGAGSAESKGGIVVLEQALRALKHFRWLAQLKIKVLLTTDCSLGNRYSAAVIQREAGLCRHVLSLKPGGPEGEVVTRRNGVGFYTAVVEGDGGFTTDYLHMGGVVAINELAHKTRQWNRLSSPVRNALVCVTSLQAEGRSGNPLENAHATVFLSFPDAETGEGLAGEIKKIARRQFVPGSSCELRGGIMHPPFSETEEVTALHRELDRVAGSVGRGLGAIARYTASEINLVPAGVPAVDGLGPVGHNTRTVNEYVEANTLVERAVLLALFLRRLAS